MVHEGERRVIGAEPEEPDHILMSQSLPHDRMST